MPNLQEVLPGQSLELLRALNIFTQDNKINRDSRRKLKQVYHLFQLIKPLLEQIHLTRGTVTLVDHGSGKSYLGFILYDLFFKGLCDESHIYGIDVREGLMKAAKQLATRLGFSRMSFLNLSIADSILSKSLPTSVDMVTALHACDVASDHAIHFALEKHVPYIVVIPCCQAEVSNVLSRNRLAMLRKDPLSEIWRHPLHAREFGSQITNVLRCLQLQAHGYQVRVTELVGWEHSLKNELIIARYKRLSGKSSALRLKKLLEKLGLEVLNQRFFTPFG